MPGYWRVLKFTIKYNAMTVLKSQEPGEGLCMDLNKVRTIYSLSVSWGIYTKRDYSTLHTDSYAKVHTEVTSNNHCYVEPTEPLLIQQRLK